jgi:hypothetical protein
VPGSRPAPVVLALLVLAILAAAPAKADLGDLYEEYRQTGNVTGCGRSAPELRDALDDVPADIRAYDPGFVAELESALEQRASGCARAAIPLAGVQIAFGQERRSADGSPAPADPRAPVPPAGLGEVAAESRTSPAWLLAGLAIAIAGLLAAVVLVRRAKPAPRSDGH